MIFGHLQHPNSYAFLAEPFQKAITFLHAQNLTELATGRYEIQGEQIFANVMEFTTTLPETKQAEAHQEYLDFQVLIKGQERIYFGRSQHQHPISQTYNAKDDYWLISNIKDEANVVLDEAGCFAIFFTGEPHKPGCIAHKPQEIKKIVIKIHRSLLL